MTYDAYGSVASSSVFDASSPVNRCGHKGLFADRLDAGVAQGSGGSRGAETARLVPGARLQYRVRNRDLDPHLMRWLQSDPNATASVLLRDMAYHGSGISPDPEHPDLEDCHRDGANLYAYLGAEPWTRSDPLGLFGLGGGLMTGFNMASMASDMMDHAATGVSIQAGLRSMLESYAYFQVDDVLWADDWDRDDDDYSQGWYIEESAGEAYGTGDELHIAGRRRIPGRVWHHIATNKYWKKGKKYSAQLKQIFDQAGMSLNDKANMLSMARGVHNRSHSPKYHEEVIDRLQRAVGSHTGEVARQLLIRELKALKQWVRKNPKVLDGDF